MDGKFSAVLFDLDGTLLNTLGDLTDAVNAALALLNQPPRTEDEVRSFIGNGVKLLARRALGEGCEGEAEAFLRAFTDHYNRHMMERTRPYPGVIDMLRTLKRAGVKVAVVSNKYDAAVAKLCAYYFDGLQQAAVGEGNGIPKKPAPDGAFKALKLMGVDPRHALYVGDSDVDVATAHNAGLPCAGVTWGFRSKDVLVAAGADFLIDTPEQIGTLVTNTAQ